MMISPEIIVIQKCEARLGLGRNLIYKSLGTRRSWRRRLQDLLVFQGTTKSTRKKSQEEPRYLVIPGFII